MPIKSSICNKCEFASVDCFDWVTSTRLLKYLMFYYIIDSVNKRLMDLEIQIFIFTYNYNCICKHL